MPSKRRSLTEKKHSNSSEVKNYNTIILEDVLCPICKSIMIDPVSLPCNHDFCLCCFDDTMKSTDLVCPLCQMRVGSWWRKAQIDGKHVNRNLQRAINARFARQVSNKLNGIDENWETPNIVVAERECEVSNNGGNKLEFKVEPSEHLESIKEEEIPLEIPEEATASSSGLSASQLPLENSEDATLGIEKPGYQSNEYFAAKRFISRIFPLSIAEREEREIIFSPIGVTASKIKAEEKLKQLKECKDYYKDVQAEKVRLLEQFEDRLASGNLFTWPPVQPILEQPSPMDRYFKNTVAPVEVQYPEPKMLDFATKEYSYRELILKRDSDSPVGFFPPHFRQHIQYIVRKGKPGTSSNNLNNSKTGHKKKLPSKQRPRINSPQKKTNKMTTSRILSIKSDETPSCSSSPPFTKTSPEGSRSRSLTSGDPFRGCDHSDDENFPLLGFDDSGEPLYGAGPDEVSELEQKALQEKLDLEFATKLQASLDRAHYTRRPFRI